ncbi:MAG: hypothetical protein DSY82_05800 [Flavobacteriia bacterium]|nr:MAG: hypothetical protein DSY82_05800 [Flavobacteriia bacterium]
MQWVVASWSELNLIKNKVFFRNGMRTRVIFYENLYSKTLLSDKTIKHVLKSMQLKGNWTLKKL